MRQRGGGAEGIRSSIFFLSTVNTNESNIDWENSSQNSNLREFCLLKPLASLERNGTTCFNALLGFMTIKEGKHLLFVYVFFKNLPQMFRTFRGSCFSFSFSYENKMAQPSINCLLHKIFSQKINDKDIYENVSDFHCSYSDMWLLPFVFNLHFKLLFLSSGRQHITQQRALKL